MRDSASGEYVVVQHRPGRRIRRFLILLAFSVGGTVLGYMVGMAEGGFRFSDLAKTRAVLSENLAEMRTRYTEARREVVSLERGRKIDRQALQEARRTIASLEGEIETLEADLSFYQNIMAPSKAGKALRVQRLDLDETSLVRRYRYHLVLTQVGDNRSYIEGAVVINVVGLKDGERKVIPLRDLSESVDDLGIRFRYRYFQDIKGELTLPEGFEPAEVQVVAKAGGGKSQKSEQIFDWQQAVESE